MGSAGRSQAIRAAEWPSEPCMVVLDELHKYRHWKRWIKGEFDRFGDRIRFLVTDSARLDVYRRGGDPLQGRYRYYRLHPFSLAEIEGKTLPAGFGAGDPLVFPTRSSPDGVRSLLAYSGFPEPLLAANNRTWRRCRPTAWIGFSARRCAISDVSSICRSAVARRPDARAVGAPLSLNALREDLEVSHGTVQRWARILEHLYTSSLCRRTPARGTRPQAHAQSLHVGCDPGPR